MTTTSSIAHQCQQPAQEPASLPETQPHSIIGRTVVLFDAGFLRQLISEQGFRERLNVRALAEALCRPGEFFRAYYYDCLTDWNERAFSAISNLPGFIGRTGHLITKEGGSTVQKGVDVQITIDIAELVHSSHNIANIVLVSGDGDFEPVVRYAQQHGVKVFVAVSEKRARRANTSRRLIQCCSGTIKVGCSMFRQVLLYQPLATESAKVVLQEGPLLPVVTRVLKSGERSEIESGEVVDVQSGAFAVCKKGSMVIARPGSRVHALKGSAICLFKQVEFTGTQGFELIPVVDP